MVNLFIASVLLLIAAIIFAFLGAAHLYCTFATNRFLPKEDETKDKMKKDYPLLTNRTTMWKVWIGFNESHSLGAITFGTVYIILLLYDVTIFQKFIC